jgi:hypothetical protein
MQNFKTRVNIRLLHPVYVAMVLFFRLRPYSRPRMAEYPKKASTQSMKI